MKELLLSECKNKNIYYLIIVDLCLSFIISNFQMKAILCFFSLFLLYYLLKDNHKIWVSFLSSPKLLRQIMLSKCIFTILSTILIFFIFAIGCSTSELKFLLTLCGLYMNGFILYTYVVADGYIHTAQINVLQLYCIVSLYLCCIYIDHWWDLFLILAPWIVLISFLCIIICYCICPKTMKKVYAYQIALKTVLGELLFIQKITFNMNKKIFHIDDLVFKNLTNKNKFYFYSMISAMILDLKFYLLALLLSLIFDVWVFVLFLLIICIIKGSFVL